MYKITYNVPKDGIFRLGVQTRRKAEDAAKVAQEKGGTVYRDDDSVYLDLSKEAQS